MLSKFFLSILIFFSGVFAHAHEDGHGQKVKNQGKYGGKMAAVILRSDYHNAAAKAAYLAELTVSADGTLRVYLYDTNLQPAAVTPKQITGDLGLKNKKTKKVESTKVLFNSNGNIFEAKIASNTSGAASLDLIIVIQENDYLAEFTRIK